MFSNPGEHADQIANPPGLLPGRLLAELFDGAGSLRTGRGHPGLRADLQPGRDTENLSDLTHPIQGRPPVPGALPASDLLLTDTQYLTEDTL